VWGGASVPRNKGEVGWWVFTSCADRGEFITEAGGLAGHEFVRNKALGLSMKEELARRDWGVCFWVASAQVVVDVRWFVGRSLRAPRLRHGRQTCRARYAEHGTVLSSRLSSAVPGPGPSKLVGSFSCADLVGSLLRFVGLQRGRSDFVVPSGSVAGVG
jgi:hypothetical protein